jgi:hypothetical protein
LFKPKASGSQILELGIAAAKCAEAAFQKPFSRTVAVRVGQLREYPCQLAIDQHKAAHDVVFVEQLNGPKLNVHAVRNWRKWR